jgi:cyclase
MLKRRLVPKLLLKASRYGAAGRMVLVTTVRFGAYVEVGDPVSQARIYQSQAADELILVDLDASVENRGPRLDVLDSAAQEIFMPITAGGGVRTLEDFRLLLAHGADKVSVNTAAVERPSLIDEAHAAFGASTIVVSIDYRGLGSEARVCTRGGRTATAWHPVAWAKEVEGRGAGEILLTSIDRDGTHQGLDVDMVREAAAAVNIPVVASGGCGVAVHFVEGFRAGADAVAAGTYFCFKDQNPMQARAHIRNAGIPIRLLT